MLNEIIDQLEDIDTHSTNVSVTLPGLYRRTPTNSVMSVKLTFFLDDPKVILTKTYKRDSGKESSVVSRLPIPNGKSLADVVRRVYGEYLRDGYVSSIDELPESYLVDNKVMLAASFDENQNIEGQYYTQPKLDGVRLKLVMSKTDCKYYTKSGKEHKPHVAEYPSIKALTAKLRDNGFTGALDGELYVDGLDLYQIQSYVKKPVSDRAYELEFIIFDSPRMETCDTPMYDESTSFSVRIHTVTGLIKLLNVPMVNVLETTAHGEYSFHEMESLLEKTLNHGYEGLIFRIGECPYAYGVRSKNLLKWKPKQDEEYLILDIVEDNANGVMFHFKSKAGVLFTAKSAGDKEYQQEVLKNKDKHIGVDSATVEHYGYIKHTLIPRNATVKVVRDYE